MPTTPAPTFSLGAIRPDDAVAAFVRRGQLRPSFRWQSVWQEEHTRAFAVAGVMRLDVLKLIREQVEDAVTNGTDLQTFSNALKSQLVKRGFWGNVEVTDPETGEVRKTRFDARRLELIYDVNLRHSHAAGRWARGMRGRMPFIVYRTMGDERVRLSHQAWDYLVLPRDHPFWDTHLPPNGWRCRCHFFFTDQAGIDKLLAIGKKLKFEAPEVQWVEFLNRETGLTERVPRGIDPGFAYNPGKVHLPSSTERLAARLARVGPTMPRAGNAGATSRAVVARMRSERTFREFLADPPPGDAGLPVAAVPALQGEPPIASVSAAALRAQQARTDGDAQYPLQLPLKAAQWALAQAIVDQGQRLQLDDGRVLWWWVRGSGQAERVLVLELERSALVWWTKALMTLTREEATTQYPPLARALP